ncbi:iron donor protein CyaY [Aestuariibacter halophilus]|uniref:Iron-sulfur cluster assembly protein CyaY n=1 Tax=Fluctibacter halophilus TaxID=226011 RepID=A0ABS8GAJ7_9ALTE|nr:iron donor protein CyaY [Aestuariibacter halophilus]MCC2617543.1 iron donor protein CyaY [Aestuariibacter halophilus]
MHDSEYHQRVDDIFMALEESLDDCPADIDYESAGGILTLIFENGSKIILNKQAPLHQIWVATKFNGHHFNLDGEQWIDERTGAEFWQFISEAASRQAEQPVSFSPA